MTIYYVVAYDPENGSESQWVGNEAPSFKEALKLVKVYKKGPYKYQSFDISTTWPIQGGRDKRK